MAIIQICSTAASFSTLSPAKENQELILQDESEVLEGSSSSY